MTKNICKGCGISINWEGLCWSCNCADERNKFLQLNDIDIENIILNIIKDINENEDLSDDSDNNLLMLVSYREIYDERIAQAALEKEIFYPSYIYYKANETIRDQLIHKLYLTQDPSEASSLMSCLAMQGDSSSLDALKYVEENPRQWRNSLYVDPSVYAEEGGWTFDKEGKRHNLTFTPCLQIEKGTPKAKEPIELTNIREDVCPKCNCKMMDVITIDGRNEALKHLEIEGKVKAVACPNCSLYNTYSTNTHLTETVKFSIMKKNSLLRKIMSQTMT